MITIEKSGLLWIEHCEIEKLEAATLRSYRNHLNVHIVPRLGHILLSDLTAVDVRNFLDAMLRESTRAMAKKCLTSLRSLISDAQGRGYIQHNVARDVKLRRSQRHEFERTFPTKDELRLLIQNAPEKYKPLLMTAVLTGMRMSELRGLVWEDIDFSRRIIRIRQRADRFNTLGATKSRTSRREIPMGATIHAELLRWRDRCPKGENGLVFPNGVGKIESHWNIYNRMFKPLMTECGIVDKTGKLRFSMHCLRHAAASLFIEQGWSPKKIQAMLGHSSITMTFDVYGHLFHNPEKDVELMDKMEVELLAA